MSTSPENREAPAEQKQPERADQPTASPIVPLLWILLPFLAVMVYAILNRE